MLDQLLQDLVHFGKEAPYCLEHDIRDLACHDWWRTSGTVLMVLGLLLCVSIAFGVVRRRRAAHRDIARVVQRAERQRAIDQEEIRQAKWTGNEYVDSDRSQSEMEDEIRGALIKRKGHGGTKAS